MIEVFRRRLWKRDCALLLAVTTLTAAGFTAWVLTWPLAAAPFSSFQAGVHDRRADAALNASPRDWAAAERETAEGLTLAPAMANGWLRLAYIRHHDAGRIDALTVLYLQKSFDAAPMGPDVTAWRVGFVFGNWSQMPPALRRRALGELIATSRYRGVRAREIIEAVRDPQGRFAAEMAGLAGRSFDPVRPPS